MAQLCIQLQKGRVPNLKIEIVLKLCEHLAKNEIGIESISTSEGNDKDPYVNVVFDTDDAKALWLFLRQNLFRHESLGNQLGQATIVTCTGQHGWEDYFLLHHFDQTLTLDEFE